MIETLFTPARLTLIILVITALFFMRGKVRADLVAICALLALLLFGILTPDEALAGFANSVVVMLVGLFIVGAGIFRTGLAKMIGSKIVHIAGPNQNRLFLLTMLVTAAIGGFVSNTGTVAIMMPIVMSMAVGAGIDTRRYLMPMAFASTMGLFTLISTTPNLVIQNLLIEDGKPPLGFFAFAPAGAIIVAVGVTLMFFLSKWLVRKPEQNDDNHHRKEKSLRELVAEYDMVHQTIRLTVPTTSALVGKSVKDLKINTRYEVSVGKVIHVIRTRLHRKYSEEIAGPHTVFAAGDTLSCHGAHDNIERFAQEYGLTVLPHEERHEIRTADSGLVEVFIMPNSQLIHHTISDSRFRELYNVNVLGIKRQGEYDVDNIRDLKLHSGDALLVQGSWDNIMNLSSQQGDLVLVGAPEKEMNKATIDRKAPVAAAIMVAMVAVLVLDIVPAVATVLCAAIAMIITGCLRNMEEAYTSISWSTVILIAAMLPMATAFDKTGITANISDFLLHGMGNIGHWGILAVIYFATSLLTLIMSNTATAVLFAPIALSVANGLGESPLPYLMAVAVGASMCFASPFSTPTNAMVMSAGRYTFMDYVRVGALLQIIIGAVMILLLPLIYPF